MRLFKVRPRKGFRMDDSRWIKWFAIATAVLTAVLVFLTIVLARYASRLDVLTDALVAWQRSNQPFKSDAGSSPDPLERRLGVLTECHRLTNRWSPTAGLSDDSL